MTRLNSVLSFGDLPEAELHSARLDGELYRIDECFGSIDEIEQPIHRATALALQYPHRLIAEQRTAAWVYGCVSIPPRTHQFCTSIDARLRLSRLQPITLREVVIGAEEIMRCGGLSLTTPLRTVLDIARFSTEFGADECEIISSLMSLGHVSLSDCENQFSGRRSLPHKLLALTRIAQSLAQPPLTR